MEDNSNLELDQLTKKLCALIMLETAQRAQTLHLIKLNNIEWKNNICYIYIVDLVKQSRPGYSLPPLTLTKNLNEPKICAFSCLKYYLEKTESLRADGNKNLFICHGYNHLSASVDTIRRWLKEILNEAGIENFSSHSFRSASTSDMKRKGHSLHSILKTAGWSKEKTFKKFYLKPIREESIHVSESTKTSRKGQNSILRYFEKK